MQALLASKHLFVIGILVLPMTGTGCAFGHRYVALQYRELAPTNDTSSGTGKTVTLCRFDDLRRGKDIGEVRNGYWMKTAAVKTQEEDLGGWVANALDKELTHRQFNVEKVHVPSPGTAVVVSGTLNECWTRLKFFGPSECTLRLNVRVDRQGETKLNHEYVGTAQVNLVLYTADEWGDGTEAALRDALSKALPEIVEVCRT